MDGARIEQSSAWDNGTGNQTSTATTILDVVHFHYSWVLFTVFLTTFVANSILTATPTSESNEPVLLGPGGKPLPRKEYLIMLNTLNIPSTLETYLSLALAI